jgi:predicted negative regulator of RcsB-dependent stress response
MRRFGLLDDSIASSVRLRDVGLFLSAHEKDAALNVIAKTSAKNFTTQGTDFRGNILKTKKPSFLAALVFSLTGKFS